MGGEVDMVWVNVREKLTSRAMGSICHLMRLAAVNAGTGLSLICPMALVPVGYVQGILIAESSGSWQH